jgi:hypothetical protein
MSAATEHSVAFADELRLLQKTGWQMKLVGVGIGLAAVLAVRLYYLQEMIAALVMFAVLLTAVAAVVLIVRLVDLAREGIAGYARSGLIAELESSRRK